jgi:flavin-dependent dehydrogenase
MLEKAVEEGAEIVTDEVQEISYSPNDKPVVTYRAGAGGTPRRESREVDFAVFAGGVNPVPGIHLAEGPLFKSLQRLIPGFRPPRVRKALIFELFTEDKFLQPIRGEVHFAQYGSKDLKIEMSSLMPKNQYITISLLGQSIDEAAPSDNMRIAKEFLELPHIKRILPREISGVPLCACTPNMTVGVARRPYGDRIAAIGDMAVSRLYKDGILSAHLTAAALADCILDVGIDKESLKRSYWPTVRQFARDNTFGRVVFLLNRLTFTSPILSRVVYQAMITERKRKPRYERRLGQVLWNIASGDDSYGRVLLSMFHPASIALILVGGFLTTVRNLLTELVFGLKWERFERHPTGVRKERFEARRLEFLDMLGAEAPDWPREFESMYTIRIKGSAESILRRLGELGNRDRQYFTPRLLDVHRISGDTNQVGSVIRYDVALRFMSFSIRLEKVIGKQYLIYRVCDGFAQGGVLVFNINPVREGVSLLSIYVAFNFPKRKNPLKRTAWNLFGIAFPGFVHDVLWNHSLCKLKEIVETE